MGGEHIHRVGYTSLHTRVVYTGIPLPYPGGVYGHTYHTHGCTIGDTSHNLRVYHRDTSHNPRVYIRHASHTHGVYIRHASHTQGVQWSPPKVYSRVYNGLLLRYTLGVQRSVPGYTL